MCRCAVLGCAVVLVGCDVDLGSATSPVIETSLCEVSGSLTLNNLDRAIGGVVGEESGITGTWLHESAAGHRYTLIPTNVFCSINGVELGDVWGPALVDGVDLGYEMRIHGQDFYEATDSRQLSSRELTASLIHRPTRLFADGALAMNGRIVRVALPETLPVVAGSAGHGGRAEITFRRAVTGDVFTCEYRGSDTEYAAGVCQTEAGAPTDIGPGDLVDVTSFTLHIARGFRGRGETETRVTVTLQVADLQSDFYRIVVKDAADIRIFTSEGDVILGDIEVAPL